MRRLTFELSRALRQTPTGRERTMTTMACSGQAVAAVALRLERGVCRHCGSAGTRFPVFNVSQASAVRSVALSVDRIHDVSPKRHSLEVGVVGPPVYGCVNHDETACWVDVDGLARNADPGERALRAPGVCTFDSRSRVRPRATPAPGRVDPGGSWVLPASKLLAQVGGRRRGHPVRVGARTLRSP